MELNQRIGCKSMSEREAKVYYLKEKKDRKAMLVFDRGHNEGQVYIYELKESISIDEMKKELLEYQQDNIVENWIENKLGFPMSWKLMP